MRGVASQCEYGNYHLSSENYILETIKDNKNVGYDNLGEIFLTDLSNIYTPLIRYQIGDWGVTSNKNCKCKEINNYKKLQEDLEIL